MRRHRISFCCYGDDSLITAVFMWSGNKPKTNLLFITGSFTKSPRQTVLKTKNSTFVIYVCETSYINNSYLLTQSEQRNKISVCFLSLNFKCNWRRITIMWTIKRKKVFCYIWRRRKKKLKVINEQKLGQYLYLILSNWNTLHLVSWGTGPNGEDTRFKSLQRLPVVVTVLSLK